MLKSMESRQVTDCRFAVILYDRSLTCVIASYNPQSCDGVSRDCDVKQQRAIYL